MATVVVLSLVWIRGILALPVSSSLSKTQKVAGLVLGLLACYTHFSLRARHMYYVKAARFGCEPAPRYPDDVLGIGFLLAMAEAIKQNSMLQQRREMLNSLGHTFVAKTFPDPYDCITTDEFENVKAVLSTKFEDWDLPSIRIKSFLPVLGKRKIPRFSLFFSTNNGLVNINWTRESSCLIPPFSLHTI